VNPVLLEAGLALVGQYVEVGHDSTDCWRDLLLCY
jgi:hypothetical protein